MGEGLQNDGSVDIGFEYRFAPLFLPDEDFGMHVTNIRDMSHSSTWMKQTVSLRWGW